MSASIYRREAIEAHARGERWGAQVKITPRWLGVSFRVIVALFLAVMAFVVFGTVYEHAQGPAIIRVEGREEVTTSVEGVVGRVAVAPGTRVRAGDVLVELRASEEWADLERLERQFDAEVSERLRDPSDSARRASLSELRARRDLARSRLDARTLRANGSGVVSDVRARPGQHVSPGDLVAAVAQDNAHLSVVAALPGHYRPMLRRGDRLRLELTGFPFVYHDLTIESVGDEIVGPTEIRRVLGQDVSETAALTGPAILIRASLPAQTFVANGNHYAFFDGMGAKATAKVRPRRFLVTLLPGLDEAHNGR